MSKTLADWLNDPRAYATTLLAIYGDAYGDKFFNWDPETILWSAKKDFNIQLPRASYDRLMVGILLHRDDAFERNVDTFIHFCNVLSGEVYDPELWNPATAADMAWGITEAFMLSPPDRATLDKGEVFSPEIIGYIGKQLDEEGILVPPDVLRMAIVDDSRIAKVRATYSGRPDTFAAITRFENIRTQAIDHAVMHGLQQLSDQLQQLPIETGNTQKVVQRMLQTLGQADEAPPNPDAGRYVRAP